tara:strand:+ start:1252 stop:1770 length:519 start_codon:yes stop_codon:yes gene_type:complete
MQLRTILILLLFLFLQSVYGQESKAIRKEYGKNSYWFRKWKTAKNVEIQHVQILMDTSDNKQEYEYNKKLTTVMVNTLTENGIESHYSFFGEEINTKALVLKFKRIKSSKVRLSTFLKTLPFCKRFQIRQINHFPAKEKHFIYTELSLSTVHPNAFEEFANALAKKLKRTLK